MSKSLTTQYKTVMQEEVPDLWARIEASLPEKEISNKVVSITEAKENIKELQADKKKAELETKRKKNKKIVKFVYSMSGVAVAGIAIAILIPFIADSNARNNAAFQAAKSKETFTSSSTKGDKESDTMAESIAEEAAADLGVNDDVDYDYRSDAVAGAFGEPEMALTDSDMVNLLSDYEGVTFEYLGEKKISGRSVCEIIVIECQSNPELKDQILYVNDMKDADTGVEYTYDLYLDTLIDGMSIYSLE